METIKYFSMDKFVVDSKSDEKLIQKMIKELEGEDPVKERSQKPNTAFLNRLLNNTQKHNDKVRGLDEKDSKKPSKPVERIEKKKNDKGHSSKKKQKDTKEKFGK